VSEEDEVLTRLAREREEDREDAKLTGGKRVPWGPPPERVVDVVADLPEIEDSGARTVRDLRPILDRARRRKE